MTRIRNVLKVPQSLFIMFCATVLFACNQTQSNIEVKTDLELTQSASAATIQIGKNFSYTLTVNNIGANDATNVTVINPIPQNANYVSVNSSQGACDQKDGTITCLLGKVAMNNSAKVNLVLTSNTVGTIQNTASVTATEVDISTTNNIVSSSITLQAPPPQANLQLDGTVAPNPVQVGQNLTYTFNITNTGPDTATSLKFTDVLSTKISYVSSSTSQGTCDYVSASVTLTCNLNSLALGAVMQVKVVVTPIATGTLTASPSLKAAELDPNATDNTTTITANVQAPPPVPTANLGLSMSATPNPVLTGQNLTYTMNLSNAGPDTANNTKIINPLPQNTTYVSSNPSQGSCAVASGTLTCNLGSLTANGTASLALVLTSSVAGTITNSASATATESDPDTANNTASDNVVVQAPAKADLKATISATPNPVLTGQNLTYTVKVSNLGPDDASAINLSDTLPANTTYVSSITSQGSCGVTNGTFSCALGNLALNASATVTMVLSSSTVGTLNNAVSVNATQTDPITSNNLASTSVSAGAYNDFQTDWCSVDSRRLIPTMASPFWDVNDCVREIERCASEGFRAVNFTGEPQVFGFPFLGDAYWNPFWAAVCDHDMVVSFHIGSGEFNWNQKRVEQRGFAEEYALQSVHLFHKNGLQVCDLLMSGVLPRFPKLRVVSVESGIGWIPFTFEALDNQFIEGGGVQSRPEFKKLPSEYFADQVYATFWFEEVAPREMLGSRIPLKNVLFETDFPHPTCLYENVDEKIARSLVNLTEAERHQVLWQNAADLYRIEVPALV